MNKKIREAELQQVNYIINLGDKEMKNKTLAVRKRGTREVQFDVNIDTFINQLVEEIRERKI